MDYKAISGMAERISFAFEDSFFDEKKRKMFQAIFHRFLSPIDPTGSMEPYDAIISLGRKDRAEFDHMVRELEEKSLLSD